MLDVTLNPENKKMGTILLSYILYVYVILVWSFVPGEYSHVLADYSVEGYSEIMKWVMGQQIYYYIII